MNVTIPFVKIRGEARVPTFRDGDVGFDLYAAEQVVLAPGRVTRVPTGISIAGPVEIFSFPEERDQPRCVPFFKIEGRSGKASQSIFPVGGIIDPSYRGEIMVLMANLNDHPVTVALGEKFAQLVLYQTVAPSVDFSVLFEERATVQETARGSNGFGSTGD